MKIITVYENPSDHPGKFVAREFDISRVPVPAAEPLIVADTYDEVHAAIPDGLMRFPRQANDDPVIVEVWL